MGKGERRTLELEVGAPLLERCSWLSEKIVADVWNEAGMDGPVGALYFSISRKRAFYPS